MFNMCHEGGNRTDGIYYQQFGKKLNHTPQTSTGHMGLSERAVNFWIAFRWESFKKGKTSTP